MLYGLSLLYGLGGTTNLYQLPLALNEAQVPLVAIVGVLLLLLVGFGFKISVVPFHFWAPDVYEGAPTPIAGFLSTVSKAAGFAVLVRVLMVVFTPVHITMDSSFGVYLSNHDDNCNAVALAQRNIKTLNSIFFYCTRGYILIGIVAEPAWSHQYVVLSGNLSGN
jgi:NADH-quinone oxidoreductase subunit N